MRDLFCFWPKIVNDVELYEIFKTFWKSQDRIFLLRNHDNCYSFFVTPKIYPKKSTVFFEGRYPASKIKNLFDAHVVQLMATEAAALKKVFLFTEWDGEQTTLNLPNEE